MFVGACVLHWYVVFFVPLMADADSVYGLERGTTGFTLLGIASMFVAVLVIVSVLLELGEVTASTGGFNLVVIAFSVNALAWGLYATEVIERAGRAHIHIFWQPLVPG